jgi:sensory rhodopsin
MDVETAALVIVYLDVVTKVGFGVIALHARVTMETVTTAEPVAAD